MVVVNGNNGKILGGCATVAGWGNRYSQDDMDYYMSQCMTDFKGTSPDKIRWYLIFYGLLLLV